MVQGATQEHDDAAVPAPHGSLLGPRTARDRVASSPWWQAALLLVLALALRTPGLTDNVLNPDEAYLATQGQVIVDGGELYRDAIDRKPPGLPYLTAATTWVLGHPSLIALRFLDAVALAGVAILVGSEARRRFGPSLALVVPLLYLLAVVALPARDSQAFTSETWVALGTIGALWCIGRDRMVAAGLALAGACLMRQTGVLFLPALCLAAWPRGGRRAVAPLVAIPAATFIVAALLLGWDDFWFWVATSGGDGYLDIHGHYRFTAEAARDWLGTMTYATIALLALVPVAVLGWRRQRDLWAGVAAGLIASTIGLRFFPHYALQLLPWLALAAAAGWSWLPDGLARRTVLGAAVLVASLQVGLSLADPPGPRAAGDPVVLAIQANSGPDDSIFVWGHLTEYYLFADRPPGTRFLTSGFLTGYSGGRQPGPDSQNRPIEGTWEMAAADLRENRPKLIVDVAASGVRNGDAFPLEHYPVIRSEVARNYRKLTQIQGVVIYERIPGR